MLILFHSILRLTFYKNGIPPGRRDAALLFSDAVCFYLGDLLPLNHEPLIDHLIDVVVPTEPLAEPAPLPHRFQEVRQPVRLVVPAHPLGDAGGGAVGEDAVHAPPRPLQVCLSLGILRLAVGGPLARLGLGRLRRLTAGHLLGPPARRKVRSPPFPPAAKTAFTPLLLAFAANPLRWALPRVRTTGPAPGTGRSAGRSSRGCRPQ